MAMKNPHFLVDIEQIAAYLGIRFADLGLKKTWIVFNLRKNV